jgi:hypothetical protein
MQSSREDEKTTVTDAIHKFASSSNAAREDVDNFISSFFQQNDASSSIPTNNSSNSLKRTIRESENTPSSKKTKLDGDTGYSSIISNEEVIQLKNKRFLKVKEQNRQRDNYYNRSVYSHQINHQLMLNELKDIARNLGIDTTGTKQQLIDRVIEFKIQQQQPPPVLNTASTSIDSTREQEVSQFISLYPSLKQSETYSRNLTSLIIHIPLQTVDGSLYTEDRNLLQSHSFVKYYNEFKDILFDNVNDGDIVLLPPGIHTVGNCSVSKSIELIGMDIDNTRTIIQSCQKKSTSSDDFRFSSANDSSDEDAEEYYEYVIGVTHSHCRLHCLTFRTGQHESRIHQTFLGAYTSVMEVSCCTFEKVSVGIYGSDSDLLVTSCTFRQLASSAVRLYKPQLTIIDQNEMSQCCLGVSDLFGNEIDDDDDLDDCSYGFKSRNTMAVIHGTQEYSNHFSTCDNALEYHVLILRGNYIHDNAGSVVGFETKKCVPLLSKQANSNVQIISDHRIEVATKLKQIVQGMYIMNTPEEKWEGNVDGVHSVDVEHLSARSDATNYQQVTNLLRRNDATSSTETTGIYPVYILRSEHPVKRKKHKCMIPEDISLVNVTPDPSKFSLVKQFDDYTLYHLKNSVYVRIFQIVFKKQMLIESVEEHNFCSGTGSKCEFCGEVEFDLSDNKYLSQFIESIVKKFRSTMTNYLDDITGKYCNWIDDGGHTMCINGHIRIPLTDY